MLIECEMSTADVDYIIIPTQTDLLDNCHQMIHHFPKKTCSHIVQRKRMYLSILQHFKWFHCFLIKFNFHNLTVTYNNDY